MTREALSSYDDERLSELATVLQREADKLQREAACKQRLADNARKEIKRRKDARKAA